MAHLDPYDGPWTLEAAAHLARRCGFGARPDELDALVALGMGASVDSYVDYPAFDIELDDLIETFPDDSEINHSLAGVKSRKSAPEVMGWWVYRMTHGNHPLQEQLTLFYHDHFVSEFRKIVNSIKFAVNNGNDGTRSGQQCGPEDLEEGLTPIPPTKADGTPVERNRNRFELAARLLLQQNNLFREKGNLGFRDLLLAVTRDPAMLLYLDNAKNIKTDPQENFGRELMELFSMGVGNYSEIDVREVTRALTGEGVDDACSRNWPYSYIHKEADHDTGNKTVFGETFNAATLPAGFADETDYLIELIMNRVSGNTNISEAHGSLPATAIHMAWKFIAWFVHDAIPIDHPAVAELGTFFYEHNATNGYNFDVKETLRKLFKSQLFFDMQYRHAMHKTPAEFESMVVRNLEAEDFEYVGPGGGIPFTIFKMGLMGMELFAPPNVAGWDHGRSWINSGAIVERIDFARLLTRDFEPKFMPDDYIDGLFDSGEVSGPDDEPGWIEALRKRLIQAPLRDEEETILLNYAETMTSGGYSHRRKVRGLIHIMMSMPGYQLK